MTFALDLPFTQSSDGSFRTAAIITDALAFNTPDRAGLTVTCTTQPAGSNVTITDGANGSSTDALAYAGVYTFSIVSRLGGKVTLGGVDYPVTGDAASGYTLIARVFCWPLAAIGAAGLLVYKSGQALVTENKTTDAQRRQILRSIARDIVPTAADSLFVANAFSAALLGGPSADCVRLNSYAL